MPGQDTYMIEKLDTYWPREKEAEKLASYCWARTRHFFDNIRSSYYWDGLVRNWLYYHNLYFQPGVDWSWGAVKQLMGGDVLAASVNEFRSILDQIYTIVTQQRPAYEVRARISDASALSQARWGDPIMEHYLRNKRMETYLKRTVKHALVLTAGFIHQPWDPYSGGRDVRKSIQNGMPLLDDDNNEVLETITRGDFNFSNPTVFDVVYDPGVREWDRNTWLLVRTYENKWDLAQRVESEGGREAIERARALREIEWTERFEEDSLYRFGVLGNYGIESNFTDIAPVWNFYHLPTDAIPEGRFFRFAGEDLPLMEPRDFPYGEDGFPIFRTTANEIVMSQLGYTVGNDLQAPQELLNAEISTIATNHHGAMFQVIWVPDGSELEEDQLGEGVVVVRGGQQPPAGVNFNADSPGHYKFRDMLLQHMEQTSGMNAVSRGQPEANFKSGEALKVMDSKAVQASSELLSSYYQMFENAGTFLLRTLKKQLRTDEERYIALVGRAGRWQFDSFTKQDIQGIDGLFVDQGNPVSKTISGRLAVAQMLIDRQMLKTPEELTTVLDTGQIQPMLRMERAQLDLIHSENDALIKGESIAVASIGEDHVLHLREHLALVDSPQAKNDQQFLQNLYSHAASHVAEIIRLTQDPQALTLYLNTGFRLPQLPPQPQVPGPGGGTPPAGSMDVPQPPGASFQESPSDTQAQMANQDMETGVM